MDTGHTWSQVAMRDHIRSRRVLVWGILLALLAALLAFVPLFDRLGYEFSFVMALAASLASADLGASAVRVARRADPAPIERAVSPARLLGALTARTALVNLALLVPPLALIAANALRVQTCDWWHGLLFYALMPAVSSVVATSAGVLTALVAGEHRRIGNALPYVVIAAAIAISIFWIYAAPPVFSYNPFAGYFPGNMYDEEIALRAPFYWARLLQLSVLVALFGAAISRLDLPRLRIVLRRPRPKSRRWPAAAVAAIAAALAMLLWGHSADLGFAFSAHDIEVALGHRYETKHFIIYYPGGGRIQRDIAAIADDHEFRYAQDVRTLGAAPPGKITSFYFRSAADKARMIGARHVDMAKPWLRQIYVNHDSFPHPVLRHEIAHVIAGAFGGSIFRVSVKRFLGLPLLFNVGLIEGTAVAADWPGGYDRELTPHQAVKAMDELGFAPPVDKILSPGFLSFSSTRSYTLAGSFVKYLLDTYGPKRLHILYRSGGDFPAAYGHSQAAVIAGWRKMIEGVRLPPGAAQKVRERFRRPSIFHRPCAHAIARRRDEVYRLVARGRYRDAVAAMRPVCSAVPGEPTYRLELAKLLTWAGMEKEADRIYRAIAADGKSVSSSLRARALIALSAAAMRAHDPADAESLLARAAKLPLADDLMRGVRARLFAVRDTGPAGPALRRYFWDPSPRYVPDAAVQMGRAAEVVAAQPSLGLGHYLVGFNLHGRGAPADAARALERALDLGLSDPLLVRKAARLLAASAYLAGDLAAVERAASILDSPGQPQVTRLLGRDWRERVYWKRHGHLPPAGS